MKIGKGPFKFITFSHQRSYGGRRALAGNEKQNTSSKFMTLEK